MYQYQAFLKNKLIAQGHTVEEIEHAIKHFRRQQKYGAHNDGNVPVAIFHLKDKTKQLIKKI